MLTYRMKYDLIIINIILTTQDNENKTIQHKAREGTCSGDVVGGCRFGAGECL